MILDPLSKVPKKEYPLPDGTKLVQFEVPASGYPNEEVNRNIFLLDSAGEVIWRIAYHECEHGDDPFVGATITPDGVITGLTWDGWRFEIDRSNGKLKKIGWTKS